MSAPNKVMVIGLDGASFNFIEPFCQHGIMPNLQRFRQRGCSGSLTSSYPPITPAAWTTFMTGKLPGKHHVLDFEQFSYADNSLRYNTSSDIHARTLWRIVSEAGGRVAAVNVPMTYPPEPVNGVMLAGHNVPHAGSEYTYPADFKCRLLERIPDYLNCRPLRGDIADEAVFASHVDTMSRTVDHYYQATRLVDEQLDWDLLMVVFPHTDMGHHVWQYMEPQSAQRHPQRHQDIIGIFTKLDRALGELFELAERRGAEVVIMSDHGHGAMRGWVRVNKLLQQWGYIKMVHPLIWLGRRLYRDYQKWCCSDKYRRPARRVDEKLGIDWSRTRAVVCHTAMWGFLYLNVRGRQPQGIVEPGAAYEALRNELITQFLSAQDPQTGERLLTDVIKPETVYGPDIGHWDRPDLLLVPPEGWKVNRRTRGRWLLRKLDEADAQGTHLLEGLWMAAGRQIARDRCFGASIQDIAPTVLALMGLAVPQDMDGRVMVDAFRQQPQVKTMPVSEIDFMARDATTYTVQEENQIQQHLSDLGYLD